MGKYIRFSILYAVLICFAGCQTVPEFPVIPSISFGSVNFKDFPSGNQDVIYLTINYKDGDGDLGLSDDDLKTPLFKDTLIVEGKKVFNKNHYNIFIEFYRKEGNQYKYDTTGGSNGSNGIFPRLLENDTKGPIEGSILYQIKSFDFFNQESSIVKIKVHIQDRALHKSNTIETPPFSVINKP